MTALVGLKNKFKDLKLNKKYIVLLSIGLTLSFVVFASLKIFALDESYWSIGDGSNTTLVTGSSDNVVVTASSVTLGKDTNWLGLDWDYRKDLSVRNVGNVVLPEDDTVTVVVDTANLESIQDDCDDLRVGYIPEDTGIMVEIPRDIVMGSGSTSCLDSHDTKVSFKLKKELSYSTAEGFVNGSDIDNRYVLFYGNDSVEEPSFIGEKYLEFESDPADGGVDDYAKNYRYSSTNSDSSFSVWIKPESFDSARSWIAVSDSGVGEFHLNSDGKVGYTFGGGNSDWGLTTSISVNWDQWNNIVTVGDYDNGLVHMFIYINGELAGSKDYDMQGKTYYIRQYFLGSAYTNNNYISINKLSRATFFNVALSANEVSDAFALGIKNVSSYKKENLVFDYDFNQIDGQRIVDISGNGHDGYLGSNDTIETVDPTWVDSGTSVYDIDTVHATTVCPLNGDTTCVNGEEPTTETGAIRYSSGGSALEFDGFNDYVGIPIAKQSGVYSEFTFEGWIKNKSKRQEYNFFGINGWTLRWNGSAGIMFTTNGGCTPAYSNGTGSYSANEWYHLAMVFDNGNYRIYSNGNKIASGTCTSNTITLPSYGFMGNDGVRTNTLWGSTDEFRFSSSARYDEAFAPKRVSFESDSDTLTLLHFDENGKDSRLSTIQTSLQTTLGVTGNGVAYDASGNGNHGLIVGAQYTNDTPIGDSGVMNHEGIFLEESTTNKVLNPSFENSTFDKYWSKGYSNVNLSASTFVAKMAKRNTEGPFASGVLVQGMANGKVDEVSYSRGSIIADLLADSSDDSQGSYVFWITPAWNGNDGVRHEIYNASGVQIYKGSDNKIYFWGNWNFSHSVDVSNWVAGNTYNVVIRWNVNTPIKDSNYIGISINGVNYYGNTSIGSIAPSTTRRIGSLSDNSNPLNAIIEGLTIYRRVLFDGTYGTDIGNGNEISQIYNNGVGKDPTEITGSWDVVFCLPTDGTAGELTTTNQAWSMPHSSNLLGSGGFMMGDSASVDGWSNYSSNKILNSSFENNLDGWNYEQEYILRDEFDTDGPVVLVNGVSTLSNAGVITPSLGSELVDSGADTFESGTYSWRTDNLCVVSNDNKTLKMEYLNSNWGPYTRLRSVDDLSTDLTIGSWYSISVDAKVSEGSSLLWTLNNPGTVTLQTLTNPSMVTYVNNFKATSTSGHYVQMNSFSASEIAWIDNFSIKPLSLPSLFSTASESTTNKVISTGITLTSGTQAGVVVNLDNQSNPQNFVIAYHDGTKAKLEKNVNGTYTTLIDVNTTYSAGAEIRVIKKGNVYKLVYNGVQIGSDQTISDASIISNTYNGLFSTYSGNSFNNFKITTNLDGSLASDGVSERHVVDTNGFLSISDNMAKFNRLVDNVWTNVSLPAISRSIGKTLIFSTSSISGGQYFYSGLSGSDYTVPSTYSFALHNGGIIYTGGGNVNVGSPSADQDTAIVLRNSGAYYFIKSSVYPNWTLLYVSNLGNTQTLYPSFGSWRLTKGNVDYVKVLKEPYLPLPLAYDTFMRDNGSLGNTEIVGPDSQVIPSLEWNANSTWNIDGGKLKDAPYLEEEIIEDVSFDNPSYWTVNNGSISNSQVDFSSDGSLVKNGILDESKWYSMTFSSSEKTSGCLIISSTSAQQYIYAKPEGTSTIIFRPNSENFRLDYGCGASTQWSLYDLSLKAINSSQTFSTVNTNTNSVIVSADMTFVDRKPIGIVTNLDSQQDPLNYIYAQIGSRSSNNSMALYKVVNGVPSLLFNATNGYVEGAKMQVITEERSGLLKVRVYYNNALVGTEQTITDAGIINNTSHGLFSTYEGNTFDNFSIFARGTDGEYNDIPAEDLTATRSTAVSYDGVSSVLLHTGSSNDKFTQTKNLVDGYTYDFSAYAYTDGSAVNSSDIVLSYNNNNIDTTYTNMGNGWYKLSGTFTGISGDSEVGVNVMTNTSVYIDGIDVKANASSIGTSVLDSSKKVFSGGYGVNSDNLGGLYRDIDITTGQDLVIRGIANSDGTSIPRLSIYDVTNNIEIGHLDGSNTSTKNNPDNLIFTGEGTLAKKASGTVTLNSNPTDGDMVEIGGVIYEFKNDISNPLSGEIYVKIGADSTESTSNLVLAISGGNGLNTNYSYGTGSVAHTLINVAASDNILSLVAKSTGLGGNGITLSELGNSILISNTSLLGGTNNSNKLRVRLLNNSNLLSTVDWHQVEVYNNLIDNPSFEDVVEGDIIPRGWGNYGLDIEDTIYDGTSYTGNSALGVTTTARDEYTRQDKSVSQKYVGIGSIGYGDGSSTIGFGPGSGANNWYQSSKAKYLIDNKFSASESWEKIYGVVNRGVSNLNVLIFPTSGVSNGVRYIDDVYAVQLNDVSLTITPATLSNSQTSDGGVILNGADSLTETLANIDGSNFIYRFKFVPAYNQDVARKVGFGNITNNRQYLYKIQFSDGYLSLHQDAPNYYYATDTTGGGSGGAGNLNLIAGTEYIFEISYKYPGNYEIRMNGNLVYSKAVTSAAVGNPVVTLALADAKYDGIYYSYPSSTVTLNSNNVFTKYGSKSVNIVTSTANDEYVTEMNLANTAPHTISAYIYNNTTGNIGGIVDSSIAQLIFNNTPVTTTYIDEGGGWWRLYATATGVVGNGKYGVQVKANKNVYIDGIQVEDIEQTYRAGVSPYTDGSLGNGYSWNGTANESTSKRTEGNVSYSNIKINQKSNSISFWLKLDYPLSYVLKGQKIFSLGPVNFYRNPGSNTNRFGFTMLGSYRHYNFNNFDKDIWHYLTITYNEGEEFKLYMDGQLQTVSVQGGPLLTMAQLFPSESATLLLGGSTSIISDFTIYNQSLTPEQILQLYNQGSTSNKVGNTNNEKYATTGTWTSQVIDLTNNGQWGTSPALTVVDNPAGGGITYQTRTSPNQEEWTEWEGVVDMGDDQYNFTSPANRYLQVKAVLSSSNQSATPSFSSMNFKYVQDTIKPSINASNIQYYSKAEEGTLQTPNDWTNISEPYISWNEGQDNTDGSGLRGYCLYLGQEIDADPAETGGLLSTDSPVHTTETNCDFIINTNHIDLSNDAYHGDTWMTSSNTPYYFKVKAVDYTGNVYGEDSSDAETYVFKLDNTVPNNPKGISAPQEYQRELTSFRVFWADSGASMATDAHSQVKGYQYRIGEEGIWYGSNHTGNEDCNDLITGTSYTLQEQFEGKEIGDELEIGENIFYIRTWDNICNVTNIYATAILQYSADAPSKPQNLIVDPIKNTINEFSFDWDIPETYSGQESGLTYCYTVNSFPSSNKCNWTKNTYLSTDAYANQPGENILYVVSKDEAGNVNYDDYTKVKFEANTSAPGLVQSLEISDISIKSSENWKLALSWEKPEETGAGVSTYQIFRSEVKDSNYSENSTPFSYVGTTSGESYTDVRLQQKEYYYIVKACDSANNCSAASNTVHMYPTGRYYSPAQIITLPEIINTSTKSATIRWVTERESDSKIMYGISTGEYFEEEISNSEQTVEHTLTLNNLTAGTTYYYKAKWTDEDGNTGMTDEMTFVTEPPPSVKDVEETYVNLDSAGIRFTTKGASKVKIYYGEDNTLSRSNELEVSNSENTYTITLSDLEDGTKYFYKINLFDVDGNEYDGTVLLDFFTPPRPEITNVQIQEKRGTAQPTIEIIWESNTEVNSIVRFYPTDREDLVQNRVDIEMIKGEHKMELNGLLPTTTYVLTVEGTDRLGNTGISEKESFTTATDTRPPQIYDLKVDKSVLSNEAQPDRERSAQLVVSWKTDEPSNSQVAYDNGLGDSYSQKTNLEDNLKTEHVVIISNLSPSTVYHLQAISVDSAENESKSSKIIAVTPKATNTVFEVVFESLGNIFNFLK